MGSSGSCHTDSAGARLGDGALGMQTELECPCHEEKGWDGETLPALQAQSTDATEETQPARASHPAFPTKSESQQVLGARGKLWGALALLEGLGWAVDAFMWPRRGCSAPHRARVCGRGVINPLSPSCSLCVFCYTKHYSSEGS